MRVSPTWHPPGFTAGQNIRFVAGRYSHPRSFSLSYPTLSSGVMGCSGLIPNTSRSRSFCPALPRRGGIARGADAATQPEIRCEQAAL